MPRVSYEIHRVLDYFAAGDAGLALNQMYVRESRVLFAPRRAKCLGLIFKERAGRDTEKGITGAKGTSHLAGMKEK